MKKQFCRAGDKVASLSLGYFFHNLYRILLAVLLLMGNVLAARLAVADLPLLPGQAVTTRFSGADSNLQTPMPDGVVVNVIDTRDPLGNGATFGAPWSANLYNHPTWNAQTMGEIFGVAVDHSVSPPDIYVASSSSLYFAQLEFNMSPGSLASGYGAIFKINGTSGAVSVLAQLPSSSFDYGGYTRYAGLGQLAINPVTRRLYVSNYEDGKIYVVNMSTGVTVQAFDHGMAVASPTVADDGGAGFTAVGRRVTAVQYNPVEGRLYYSVAATFLNEIWSAPLLADGSVDAAGARKETTSTRAEWWGNDAAVEITDLAFDSTGKRMLAGITTIHPVQLKRLAHYSGAQEWVGATGGWALNTALESANGNIPVGNIGGKGNSTGGVSYGYNNYGSADPANETCEDSMVLMGDGLIFDADNNRFVYGLQITPLTGTTTDTLGWDDYFVDVDGGIGTNQASDKGSMGDVDILSACSKPLMTSLGSLVWNDVDNDGIQDAGEAGLAGAVVSLWVDNGTGTFVAATETNGNLVANQTTGADGLYYFSNLPVGTYRVRVVPPAKYFPSSVQNTTADNNIENDSNIATEPVAGTFESASITLGLGSEPGESGTQAGDAQDNSDDANGNMTLDLGFVIPKVDVALTKALDKPTAKRGETVVYTLTVSNSSTTLATGVRITDQLPAGVTYVSDDGMTLYGADVFDAATGVWMVGDVSAGGSKVLHITVTVN